MRRVRHVLLRSILTQIDFFSQTWLVSTSDLTQCRTIQMNFFLSTRCQCGPKTHMRASMRLENAQCEGTFIFTLSRFNKSALSIEDSVELMIDEAVEVERD